MARNHFGSNLLNMIKTPSGKNGIGLEEVDFVAQISATEKGGKLLAMTAVCGRAPNPFAAFAASRLRVSPNYSITATSEHQNHLTPRRQGAK
jgi:hypothetical protein